MRKLLFYILLAASAAAQAEPLTDFRAKLDVLSNVNAGSARVSPPGAKQKGAWQRIGPERVAGVSYDVRKSDSLISPFVAWVEVKIVEPVDRFPSQSDAVANRNRLAKSSTEIGTLYRVEFAYRDGRWTPNRGQCDLDVVAQARKLVASIEPPASMDVSSGRCMGKESPFVRALLF